MSRTPHTGLSASYVSPKVSLDLGFVMNHNSEDAGGHKAVFSAEEQRRVCAASACVCVRVCACVCLCLCVCVKLSLTSVGG